MAGRRNGEARSTLDASGEHLAGFPHRAPIAPASPTGDFDPLRCTGLAREVAHLLEISGSAVKRALHCARVTLEKHYDTNEREKRQMSCTDAETSTLLSRYVQAWETDDVAGLVALLKEEATLSIPPFPAWSCGHDAIRATLTAYPFRFGTHGLWRLYPTVANGEPAFAFSRANESKDAYLAFGIQVVTLDSSTVARYVAGVTMFHGPSLVAFFGLPLQLPTSSNK